MRRWPLKDSSLTVLCTEESLPGYTSAGILYKMHYKMVPDSYQKNKILMQLLGIFIQFVVENSPVEKI